MFIMQGVLLQSSVASAAAAAAASGQGAASSAPDSNAGGAGACEQAAQESAPGHSTLASSSDVNAAVDAVLAAAGDVDELPDVDVNTGECFAPCRRHCCRASTLTSARDVRARRSGRARDGVQVADPQYTCVGGQEGLCRGTVRFFGGCWPPCPPLLAPLHMLCTCRDRRGLRYTTLTYGEIEYKPFVAALRKIELELEGEQYMGGVFYDIGAGTGKPVFAAALYGRFVRCVGIEILEGLFQLSQGLLQGYKEKVQQGLPLMKASTHVDLLQGDFTEMDISDADVWFANSTCFNEEVSAPLCPAFARCRAASPARPLQLMDKLAAACEHQKVGTFGITFTKRLPHHKWKVLSSELHQMSWGPATVHIQRKVLP